MGEAAKHEHNWPHGGSHGGSHGGPPWMRGSGRMPFFFIPIPMAFFGVLISFMFGWTVGAMAARKQEAMCGGGYMKLWKMHGMGGMGKGMGMSHHHHGEGAPACREWHGDWPEEQESPAEDVKE